MESISGFEVKITRKIEEIPEQDWSKVFPAVAESYYFLKTLDESGLEQFSFFYIMLYEKGMPAAAAPCFLMRFPFDMTVEGPLKSLLSFIKKFLPNILCPRTLICGTPMGQGRIGIGADRPRVMQALCACMEKIAREEKAPVFLFKDFTDAWADDFKPLLKDGFTKIESIPYTEMDINFSSFEEYLKTLSQSSREGLRRNYKKVDAKAKIELEVAGSVDDDTLSQLYGLYLQTFRKQDIGLEKLTRDFFKCASRNMPKESLYFLWRIEGRLVAFAFCLVSGGYFIDYYLGFDYSVSHQYYLYFVRFRDLLKWCIGHGIKKYEMGVTTYEPKKRLGFNFTPFYYYLKYRNRLINPFIKIVAYFIEPGNFDPVLKDMKKGTR